MNDIILIRPEPISPLPSPEVIEEHKTTGETEITEEEHYGS